MPDPKIKLFISYSHLDEKYVKEFIKHITPLKTEGLIEDWYDRKIAAGQDFRNKIDENFEKADIICLFISANFLASKECLQEKANAIGLKRKKGVVIIPIIVSRCGWKDDKDLSKLLALPTDGNPVVEFADSNVAWNTVYESIKSVIKMEVKIKQLKLTDAFSGFLQSMDLLTKAHSQKENVFLNDIFVYPVLEIYNDLGGYDKKESAEKLIEEILDYPKILLTGDDQSGKTTLCKKIFTDLREKNFVPVYISDKVNRYQGKIENKIEEAFKKQYEGITIEEIEKSRIVPILDDFHFAKNEEKHIADLALYSHQIVVVDDVFCLSFRDESVIKSFTCFKIQEFTPSLRNQLIKKWVNLTDIKNGASYSKNEIYKSVDNITELVDDALGKIIGNGIMPAYPFFISSVINVYETWEKPHQEITSQGYCYQALVYIYLSKQCVKNEDIDTYINFLTEFAFYLYTLKKSELAIDEFKVFMDEYLKKYNLPIKQDVLLRNLCQTQIIALDGCNNYSFCYPYLYYFFVAKYLAEHVKDNKTIIDSIINNLHEEKNAYIAVFLSHHSKDAYILDEIVLNAMVIFDKYKPATLNKAELRFFDEQVDNIVKAVLPSQNITPEEERAKRLKNKDAVEQFQGNKNKTVAKNEMDSDVLLRKSMKTVEVMGSIIKNRAGSLERPRLESIVKEAINVHLRLLTLFFELIKNGQAQQEMVEYISSRLTKIVEEKARKPSQEKLEKLSKTIFWNVNFFFVYGILNKIIHSVGSDKLIEIIKKVCDTENTQASFLIKHGILMWYQKNLQVDAIVDRIGHDDFSETAKRIMNFMIVNHCAIHSIGFKERAKIENNLGIPQKKLLIQQSKIEQSQ
ncbi:MAG: TIR domain-containing protein [Elusimicrobiales bacterium]|nr:TIR domain-containing protein [Elusimicrobiales bacterium]